MVKALEYLPRGNMLDDESWAKRHRFLQWVLVLHPPGLFLLALLLGRDLADTAVGLSPVLGCLLLGYVLRGRRISSFFVTAGLVYCSAVLVWVTNGSIESHFHFFVIIGFIALYQDWVPFLWNIVFTVLSHGLGSWFQSNLMFNHPAAQNSPWLWSLIHGLAVLAACAGMVVFWRVSEDEQQEREELARRLSDAEIGRRRFTSELLVNLARRNQTMLYRQLDIINQLEEKEQDPDALAELFRLDHLATRVRRNAESLLVLSGEEPYRVWSAPVPLHDVVRAAIAETEHLDRVEMSVDEDLAVAGQIVTDLTHLLAELTENAVRFSPPEANVDVRTRRYRNAKGYQLLTIEDCGVGMPPAELESANRLLAAPPEVDLSVSRQLGFHVVARLAQRHGIKVSLTPTPGSGITAAVLMPAELFAVATEDGKPEPALAGAVRGALPSRSADAGASRSAGSPDGAKPAKPNRPAKPALVRASTGTQDFEPGPSRVEAALDPSEITAALPAVSNGTDLPGTADWRADRSTGSDGASSANGLGASWVGWWEPPAAHVPQQPQQQQQQPAQPPAPLTRRVPQTHLAPELRWPPPDAADLPAHVAPQAPEALTRYQQSRRAARSEADGDRGRS